MPTVYLSVGSNIDAQNNFKLCAHTLKNHLHSISWSPVFQSPAIGLVGADFLNAVVSAETSMSANDTDKLLKQIEKAQGRDHTKPRFSSRTLDIDLLLYDQLIQNTPELTLPRDELYTEAFVLLPLVKLNPDLVDPVSQRTFQSILNEKAASNAGFIKNFKEIELAL